MRMTRALTLTFVALALTAACATPTQPGLPSAPATGADPAVTGEPGTPTGSAADKLGFSAITTAGQSFDGQSLRGKPSVLWFWAAWCSVCASEAPTVAKAAAANPGVTFVGVSALDELPAMKRFVATHGIGGFTHLADPDAAIWLRFGVTSQPAHAFIAADGTVQVVSGALSETELNAHLSSLTKP